MGLGLGEGFEVARFAAAAADEVGVVVGGEGCDGEGVRLPGGEGGEAEVEVLADGPGGVLVGEFEADDAAVGVVKVFKRGVGGVEAEACEWLVSGGVAWDDGRLTDVSVGIEVSDVYP